MKRWLFILLVALLFRPVEAQPALRLGILGDSQSDEYRGTDNRGGAYAATTLSWDEQLVHYRGVYLGEWGTRTEPRRTGYGYNWARTGATTSGMIAQSQHTGLAAQVDAGQVDAVVVMIGSNDFAPYNGNYYAIYSGNISGAALDSKIMSLVWYVELAVNTVRRTTPVPVVLMTIGDWNNSALVLSDPAYSDPVKRARVTAAIQETNRRLITMMALKPATTIFDADLFTATLLERLDGNGNITVGGELIHMMGMGDEPHNGLLGDRIHAGTVMEGLIANGIIEELNKISGHPLALFADTELLTAAGILAAPLPATATNLPTIWLTPTSAPATETASPMPLPTDTDTPTDVPTVTDIPTFTPTAAPVETTITVQIGAGIDDVNEDGAAFSQSAPTVWLGNGQAASVTGLRFTGVDIPPGATITAARLEVYSTRSQWINLSFQMAADNSDHSAAFSSSSKPSTRPLTSARVNHSSNVSWATGQWYSFTGLHQVVQEIVSRPGWQSGNALALILRGTGGAWARKYGAAFDGGAAYATRLVISYR